MPNVSHTPQLTHSQQVRLLQRRILVAEEGWRYSFDALNTLLTQIKTIDFTQEGVATTFQNNVIELFPDHLTDAETDTEWNSNDSEDESEAESGNESVHESGSEAESGNESVHESGSEAESEGDEDSDYDSMPPLEDADEDVARNFTPYYNMWIIP